MGVGGSLASGLLAQHGNGFDLDEPFSRSHMDKTTIQNRPGTRLPVLTRLKPELRRLVMYCPSLTASQRRLNPPHWRLTACRWCGSIDKSGSEKE